MSLAGRTTVRLRFRPSQAGDGSFRDAGSARQYHVAPPDWDRALAMLRTMNTLRDSNDRRIASLVTVDGFEPWWFVQDRLYRFYLLTATKYFDLLEGLRGSDRVQIEGCPSDLRRLASAISGRSGFPQFEMDSLTAGSARELRGPRAWKGSLGKNALRAITLLSLGAFRTLRRDTVLYIIDQVSPGLDHDFRLTPLYEELRRRGYRFAEYAHALGPRSALANFVRRRRPVAFLGAFDDPQPDPCEADGSSGIGAPPPSGANLEGDLLWALVPSVLAWCRASGRRYRGLVSALRFQGARRAVIFDDNRHNHELVAACKSLGIRVLGFQHGVFNRYHTGLMAYGFDAARSHGFDLYGVWGPLFCDRLLRSSALYAPDQVFLSGPLRVPETRVQSGPENREDLGSARPRVMLVSEPLARKQEVAPYVEALRAEQRFALYLKLRPGEGAGGIGAYGPGATGLNILQTGTIYGALLKVDVVLGTYSTVLYEAALALCPTVWLKTATAYGRELVEDGLAEVADGPEDIIPAIERALALPVNELVRRREQIWGNPLANGAASLLDEAERSLWSAP